MDFAIAIILSIGFGVINIQLSLILKELREMNEGK